MIRELIPFAIVFVVMGFVLTVLMLSVGINQFVFFVMVIMWVAIAGFLYSVYRD